MSTVFGVTIDSIDRLDDTLEALKALPVKPSVRICFDPGEAASSYLSAIEKLSKVATLVGQPIDSSDVINYTPERYRRRFESYLKYLGHLIKTWEVGNEVNGSWLWIDDRGQTKQQPESVCDAVIGAYQAVKAEGLETMLTLYGDFGKGRAAMAPWLGKYLGEGLPRDFDYVTISFYDDDLRPPYSYGLMWEGIFGDLGKCFPTSKLGFGEIGHAHNASVAKQIELIRKYYTMVSPHPRFFGGYYYWNFFEDCVPKHKAAWAAMAGSWPSQPSLVSPAS
jgi:hypothetical protein